MADTPSMPRIANTRANEGSKRVTLWNTKERRKLSGNAAPYESNLLTYLHENQAWEVYDGQDRRNYSKKLKVEHDLIAPGDLAFCSLAQGSSCESDNSSNSQNMSANSSNSQNMMQPIHTGRLLATRVYAFQNLRHFGWPVNVSEEGQVQQSVVSRLHVASQVRNQWLLMQTPCQEQQSEIDSMNLHGGVPQDWISMLERSEERQVTLCNPTKIRKLSGNAAPLTCNLEAHLSTHPVGDILRDVYVKSWCLSCG